MNNNNFPHPPDKDCPIPNGSLNRGERLRLYDFHNGTEWNGGSQNWDIFNDYSHISTAYYQNNEVEFPIREIMEENPNPIPYDISDNDYCNLT